MTEHEGDCGCAACDTLVMGPNPDWRPTWLAPGERQCRCVLCHTDGDQAYWTALGMSVGVCCGRRIEGSVMTEQEAAEKLCAVLNEIKAAGHYLAADEDGRGIHVGDLILNEAYTAAGGWGDWVVEL